MENKNKTLLLLLTYMAYAAVVIMLAVFLPDNSAAYDAEIRDQYGRITGYVKNEDDTTVVTDVYGRPQWYIQNNEIKNEFGEVKRYVKDDAQ